MIIKKIQQNKQKNKGKAWKVSCTLPEATVGETTLEISITLSGNQSPMEMRIEFCKADAAASKLVQIVLRITGAKDAHVPRRMPT